MFKILEQNGIENENIDGGAFNNFAAGNRDGVLGGVLSECAFAAEGNTVSIGTGVLIIHGIRVKIEATETIALSSFPNTDTRYQIVARINLENKTPSFSLDVRSPSTVIQDELYQSNNGIYEVEIGRFTHSREGRIIELTRTIDTIYGASPSGALSIGDVQAYDLDPGMPPEADVTKRMENGKELLDFSFGIPKAAGSFDPNGNYAGLGAGYLAKNVQIAASSSSIGWWKVGSIDLAVTGKASVSSSTVIRVTGLYSHITPSGEIEVNGRLQDGALNPSACPLYITSGNLDPSKFYVSFEEKVVSLYVRLDSTYSRYSFTVVQDDIEAKSNSGYFTFNPVYIGSSAPDGAVYAVRQIHASMSEKSSQNLLFNGNFKVNTLGATEYVDNDNLYHACVDGWEFGYGDCTLSVLSNGVKITKEADETNPTNFQTTDIKSMIGAAGKYTISFAVDDLNAVQQVYAFYAKDGSAVYLTVTSKNDTVNNIAIRTFTVTDEQFTAIQQCDRLQIGIQKKQDYESLTIYYAKLEEGEISTAPNSIVNNATSAQIANIAKKFSNTSAIGSTAQPVYINSEGIPTVCKDVPSKQGSYEFMNVGSANKLAVTQVGSSNQPVYFNSKGIPIACSGVATKANVNSASMVPYGGQATTLSALASGGVYNITANGFLRIAYQTTAADNYINMKQVDSEGADIWGALANGLKSYGSGYPFIYMPVAAGDHIKVDFSSSVKIIQVQLIKVKAV